MLTKARRTFAVCPPSSDVLWIVLAVTGCIVAVGLVLLCSWKVFVTVHDRREYASFENEVKARREMVYSVRNCFSKKDIFYFLTRHNISCYFASVLLDRPFCERSILCFAHVFSPTHFFRRLQTDIFETFPHDVALLEKEALLCQFPKSAPNKNEGRKTPNFAKSRV